MSVLSRVLLNPEIPSTQTAFVTELVSRAKHFVTSYCRLPRFPELSQGYSKSGENADEDISALSTNSFYISVNESGNQEVKLTLANCTTGDNTATHIQNRIRANSTYGFEEVSVSFDAEKRQYTITSGRYGKCSSIKISFVEGQEDVCRSLKLGASFGGTELPGSEFIEELETVAVNLVESKYRKLGLEGMQSGSLPGGVSFNVFDLDPFDKEILIHFRRLY